MSGAMAMPERVGLDAVVDIALAERHRQNRGEPFDRLFKSDAGRRAIDVTHAETHALVALETLSVAVLAEALAISGQVSEEERVVVRARARPDHDGDRDNYQPPVVIVMSPRTENIAETRLVTRETDLPSKLLEHAAAVVLGDLREADHAHQERADQERDDREWQGDVAVRVEASLADVAAEVLATGEGVAQLLEIARPEVLLTRRPRMELLCAPTPHLEVATASQSSTAGLLCRDASGQLGVTACFHGTGPVGTPVTVAGLASEVARADVVQDIVFIPLPEGFLPSATLGRRGLATQNVPGVGDRARFEGAINQMPTRVQTADAGLLRLRPTVQLKLQTSPDTDTGDSGSALVDDNDRVLAFAFERTAVDDFPEFTDWIWASNAMTALGLTPECN